MSGNIPPEWQQKGLTDTQLKGLLTDLGFFLQNPTYKKLRTVLDNYPHPPREKFERFIQALNHSTERVSSLCKGVDFGYFDDKIMENYVIVNGERDLDRCKQMVSWIDQYEQARDVHIHKGSLFLIMGQYYTIEFSYYEKAFLFYHRSFTEDNFRHSGTDNLPPGHAYQFITLHQQSKNPYIRRVANFFERQFLDDNGFQYQQFYDAFLGKALALPPNEPPYTWLDHIIYFTNLLMRIEDLWHASPGLFASILGPLKFASVIADFCLLIESLCKLKLGRFGTGDTYSDIHVHLKPIYGWTSAFNGTDFKEVSLKATLQAIFNKSYKNGNQLENSFFLSWGLRNPTHHTIFSQKICQAEWMQIIKTQMRFFLDYAIMH